jgi:outer membrane protein assembly factor BamB
VKRLLGASLLAVVAVGCGSASHPVATTSAAIPSPTPSTPRTKPVSHLVSPLRLPLVRSRILPGYLLVADRNNDRVLLLAPDKRIVWQLDGLRQPDDAFFTPGFRSVITNEEFNDTLSEISLATKKTIWTYGHAGVAGSGGGYLDAPDDAYRIGGGITSVADIKNCRIVQLRPNRSILRVLGGSCRHDPPNGFASPNGDTPLPDGGLLVTEIGGWIDRLDRAGKLVWSIRSPVSYPSDAQLLPNGHLLVSGFTTPGRVIEMTASGRVVWSFGSSSGVDRLDRPSLAIRLPNGLVAINDDWRHRVILVDPKTSRIVWQYGHTDVASSSVGYLSKPDGMDFLPASPGRHAAFVVATATTRAAAVPATAKITRIGSLPAAASRVAAVALPDGRIVVLGGLVAGSSSRQVLIGTPERLRSAGSLPAPTHDAAAVLLGKSVLLFGGGEAVSAPYVFRIDLGTGSARRLHPLDEPLSDLGAATVGGHVYLVGGYTGTKFASAILRVGRNDRTTTVARLSAGVRYAGVAALGRSLYVAGGVTPAGTSDAVYRVDLATHRVVRIGTLPTPIAHAPLVSARGSLWLVGGQGSRDILRIDPRTGKSVVAARLPRALPNAAAVALPSGRVIVVGGDRSNAVWALDSTA